VRAIRNYFKGWNWFEIAFMVVAVVAPVVVGIILKSNILHIATCSVWLFSAMLLAKAKPEGYFFDIGSSVLYPIVAFQERLFGEVIVQVFIILPIAVYGLISWLRNKRVDRKVGTVAKLRNVRWKEVLLVALSQVVMGVGYFFLLRAFDTAFLWISTVLLCIVIFSTYFLARRCIFGFIGFIVTDVLQIAIWVLITVTVSPTVGVMIIAPFMLLINDIYGVINWTKLKRAQGDVTQNTKLVS
jgi:nicotinamide mononucleotide transporter